MLSEVILVYALLAGIFSIVLFAFTLFFEKNKKHSRTLLLWAVFFLAAAFVATEYVWWLEGFYMFDIITKFNFPMLAYFGIWFAFIIWLFESRGERKIWMILLLLLVIVTAIALSCSNCVRF